MSKYQVALPSPCYLLEQLQAWRKQPAHPLSRPCRPAAPRTGRGDALWGLRRGPGPPFFGSTWRTDCA